MKEKEGKRKVILPFTYETTGISVGQVRGATEQEEADINTNDESGRVQYKVRGRGRPRKRAEID